MITELSVSHYKSIYEETARFNNINVLVGKNGSGKSNIVDALSFISDIFKEDLDFAIARRHGIDSIRQWSKFKPYHITISLKIITEEGQGSYKIIISSSRNSYKVLEEHLEWNGKTYYTDDQSSTSIHRNQNGQLEISTNHQDDDIDFSKLREIKIDHNESFLNIQYSDFYPLRWLIGYIDMEICSLSTFSIFPNTIRAPQNVSKGSQLSMDGGNIASILKHLPTDRRRLIVKFLKAVMPNLVNIQVRSTAGYYVLVFLVSEPDSQVYHELNMSQVSDGTLRILGILTALFQSASPSKVILEEPEQMIHPALLIVLRDAILEYYRRNTNGQIFITTHSSVLMDLFDVSNIIAVEYDGNSTRCGPISQRQKEIVRSGLMTLGDVLLAEELEIA